MSEPNQTSVIFIGDTNVGKSAIIQAKINRDIFVQNTIGVDSNCITIDGENLLIYDTAGQERYRSLTQKYFANAKIAVIVFDLSCRKSFKSVEYWFDELKNHCKYDKLKIVLVGNKSDLPNSEINEDEVTELASKMDASTILTSALNLTNIDELFDIIASFSMKIPVEHELCEVTLDKPINQENKCC